MKIGDLLTAERIVVPLPAKTLQDAAEQLIASFVDTGVTTESEKLIERIAETPAREAVIIGDDAFILHFRSDAVGAVAAALGVTVEPIALESESERTARIVVVLVAPFKESSVFLQAVNTLDRTLGREEIVAGITSADTPEEIARIESFLGVELPGHLSVADVMTPRPRSVWPDSPLVDVAKVMLTNRLSALPVTSEAGDVLGIVTFRDILRVALPRYLRKISSGEFTVIDRTKPDQPDPRLVHVRDVMDRSVFCVSADQTLADVANMITGKGLDPFPVVRDGILVGMLTRADIVRRLYGP